MNIIQKRYTPPTPPPPELDPLLNTVAAAKLLAIDPETLANWRAAGRYTLPFVKVGRLVRYRPADLTAFIASRTVNTAATAAR